jgi:hypothetical protein
VDMFILGSSDFISGLLLRFAILILDFCAGITSGRGRGRGGISSPPILVPVGRLQALAGSLPRRKQTHVY